MSKNPKFTEETGHLIGKGDFGAVFLVKMPDGRRAAKKYSDLKLHTAHEIKLMLQETNLLQQVQHPNIIESFGQVHDVQNRTLSIYMRYAEQGDLLSYIQSQQRPNRAQATQALAELSDALHYLHNFGQRTGSINFGSIIHRDIKPANILLDRKHFVHADLGIARRLDPGSVGQSPPLRQGATRRRNGTVHLPDEFDTLRTSLKAMCAYSPHTRPEASDILNLPAVETALSKRDCHLANLEIEELKAGLKRSQEAERAALEQLAQAKLEAKRARNELSLQRGSTRCDNKDDVLDRIKALASSPAASRDRDFTSTSSSPERTTRTTRQTAPSRPVVLSSLRTTFKSLQIASKLSDVTFPRAVLVEHAKKLGLLPAETGEEYVGNILASNKDEWESRGKSWKLRN
ncbi:unnamed protein product [Tilletia controversa]|nr:unnamed protein product [Tilletia controversa]CAD6981216.1 unnamed protein product [Tilletia controversa]